MQGQPTLDPGSPALVHCSRCGRAGTASDAALPDGWEGTLSTEGVAEAFCPGCQLGSRWHPMCVSVFDADGQRLGGFSRMPEEELGDLLMRCHYLDREHSYAEGEAPATWTCPECGGTEWDLVRMVVDFVTPDDPRVQHSNRFRHVSNRYPYMVAMAYDRDLAAAAADSDEEVAARVAAYERAQGLKPRDWYAIGAEERN